MCQHNVVDNITVLYNISAPYRDGSKLLCGCVYQNKRGYISTRSSGSSEASVSIFLVLFWRYETSKCVNFDITNTHIQKVNLFSKDKVINITHIFVTVIYINIVYSQDTVNACST